MSTLDLDEMELTEAARGARCLAAQAGEDANRQTNPGQRELFERTMKFHQAMAEKFEQARKSSSR
jgi:hypothetical protein